MVTALLFGASAFAADAPLPQEPGMYLKDSVGNWQGMEANVFTWRAGGIMKSSFTAGIIKHDVNAVVRDGAAETKASFEDQFLVVVPKGNSISEYQMVQFHEHHKSREFRLVTGAVWHVTSGATRDLENFHYRKVGPDTYLVSFQNYEGGGQFGFLPPPSFSPTPYAAGKIYCFEMRN